MIIYTSKFQREYKKLMSEIKMSAKVAVEIFKHNPRDPRLRLHKLSGRFADFWSFSVSHNHRIICEFDKDKIYFHSIGDHSIYQ